MKNGFLKVKCYSPKLRVADVKFNTAKIIQAIWDSDSEGVKLLVLPELCVSGASCADLFLQRSLLDACENAILDIAEASREHELLVVVGAPLRSHEKLYDCAVVIFNGQILGVVPKSKPLNCGASYELRHFSVPCGSDTTIRIGEMYYPFSSDLIFECATLPELKLGVEIGSDLFSVGSPSERIVALGASVIACPMATPTLVGSEERALLVAKAKSLTHKCAYLIANADEGESTTDVLFAPHNIICENGKLLSESAPFSDTAGVALSEIDLQLIASERQRDNTFSLDRLSHESSIYFILKPSKTTLTRAIDKLPFVVDEGGDKARARYEKILTTQARALAKRLVSSHSKSAVMGISGGLDSTLGMLVVLRAFDYLGWDRSEFYCISMPCFGTSARTKSNAQRLCELCGVTFKEIDISEAVRVHFADIGHSEDDHSVAFENAQARERTQILMDFSNKVGALVVGTGDLSEIALGWSTYNADHMSMYNPNCDVSKTLVRALVGYEATRASEELGAVLCDILGTPVSPELLPPDKSGKIAQKTEDLVGPYELHDFFLYYFIRYAFAPSKIYRLAKYAFSGEYDDDTIYKWLQMFIKRFFTQQFKRSCSPDGVKIGSVALSPRGDLKMPSDATYWVWLDELEANSER